MYPTINVTKYRPISDRAKEMAVKQSRFLPSSLLVIALIWCLFALGCKSEDKPAFMRSANDDAKIEKRNAIAEMKRDLDAQQKVHSNKARVFGQLYLDRLEKMRTHNEGAASCRQATDQWGVYDTSHCTPEQLKAEQDFENE